MQIEFKCNESNCKEQLNDQNYLVPLEQCQHTICLSHIREQLQKNQQEHDQFVSVVCYQCNQISDVPYRFASKIIAINNQIFDKNLQKFKVQEGNLLICSKHNKKVVMKSQKDETLACTTCLKSLNIQDFEDFENEQMIDHFKKLQVKITQIKQEVDNIFIQIQNIIDKKIILNEQSFNQINQAAQKYIDDETNKNLQINEKTQEIISEDDWFCEKCYQMNKKNKENFKSCYCNKCNSKNDNIEFILNSQKLDNKQISEKKIFSARVAEQCLRFEDMVAFLEEIIQFKEGKNFTEDEKNLLSFGFKNFVKPQIDAIRNIQRIQESQKYKKFIDFLVTYKSKIEKELYDKCIKIIDIVKNKCLKFANDDESKAFFYKMVGDYYRYLAEVEDEAIQKQAKDGALEWYDNGSSFAKSLSTCNSIRVGLALNYGVLFYENLKNTIKALEISKKTLDEALINTNDLNKKEFEKTKEIIELLKENISMWEEEQKSK